jgi:hypothetical protein
MQIFVLISVSRFNFRSTESSKRKGLKLYRQSALHIANEAQYTLEQ